MKCNIRELAHLSDQPCIIEGRLNYKKISNGSYRNQTVFKERWFRLIKNYLFYFKISEMGKFDTKNPAGMFVMENSSIQMEHGLSIPFSFSISFMFLYLLLHEENYLRVISPHSAHAWVSACVSNKDEPEKRHIFAARAEDNVVQWVMKLRECSYEYLRSRLHTLQSKIYSITGKDPLLLVPRNEGACLWAPAVPYSTTPACTVNTSSFSCHLHTNGAFTLERSKSDVQTHRHLQVECKKKTTFYTEIHQTNNEERNASQVLHLERSQTSVLLPGSTNVLNTSIFDNRPMYSRTAPSPPVRTKLSPSSRRVDLNPEVKMLTDHGRHLGTTGILDETPVPPRRKLSPKHADHADGHERQHKSTEDLITF